jgi:hypothetical protein
MIELSDEVSKHIDNVKKHPFIKGAISQHQISYRAGWNEALASFDLESVIDALRGCLVGCTDAIGMFEDSEQSGQKIKAEIQAHYNKGRAVLKQLESMRKV